MVFSKFIIEDDYLTMAKCTFHKQLATDVEKVKGGGWFRWDDAKKAFILGGESHDFGPAKMEDIKKCIEDGNVYGRRGRGRKMHNHKFLYDVHTKLVELN